MDDVDLRLLQELLSNSRVTYRELAGKLGLSVNSTHKRVQNLMEVGIIRQFTVRLTPRALPQVWVRVCGTSATTLMADTVERLSKNQHTAKVAISSSNSLHVTGILRDASELGRYVNFVTATGEIAEPTVRMQNLPTSSTSKIVTLTGTDYRILASLQENSRKPTVDIATELGISAKTVRRRLERMEKNELIYYGIRFDHTLLGGIVALLDFDLKSGVDREKVTALIRSKYTKNLLEIRTFSTMPKDVTIEVWTQTMSDLKALQNSLQKEGVFQRIVPILVYDVHYFDAWGDTYIREKATTC